METFSNILVAIDLSKNCKPALKVALKMQAETETEVTFIYVLPDEGEEVISFRSLYKEDISGDKLLENFVYPRVTDWLDEIDRGLTEEHEVVARIGKPAEEILEYAKEERNDLIITGTHGRSGFQRWWIGSVAERIVRQAECPVLTIRSKGDSTARIIEE